MELEERLGSWKSLGFILGIPAMSVQKSKTIHPIVAKSFQLLKHFSLGQTGSNIASSHGAARQNTLALFYQFYIYLSVSIRSKSMLHLWNYQGKESYCTTDNQKNCLDGLTDTNVWIESFILQHDEQWAPAQQNSREEQILYDGCAGHPPPPPVRLGQAGSHDSWRHAGTGKKTEISPEISKLSLGTIPNSTPHHYILLSRHQS